MESAILNEIKLLENNKDKVQSGLVYDLIIHSIKGKYVCEEQRKKFAISRTLHAEKIYKPNYAQEQANSFLDCYADMTKQTKLKCKEKYSQIFDCLTKNMNTNGDFPEKCVLEMEDFISC